MTNAEKDFYIFNDLDTAQKALDYINSNSAFPIYGRNAATGAVIHDNITNWWVSNVKERVTDGKFFFRRLPFYFRQQISTNQQLAFENTYPNIIEQFQDNWVNRSTLN